MGTLRDLVTDPYRYDEKVWLKGKERNSVRAKLRKALKANKLLVKRTYYDYYDSCHAPVETPNAQFTVADGNWIDKLKAGGGNVVYLLPDGTYEVSNSYSNYVLKIQE